MQRTAAFVTGIVLIIFAGLNAVRSKNCATEKQGCTSTPCCEGFKCMGHQYGASATRCYKRSHPNGPCDYDFVKPCPAGYRCSHRICVNTPCVWNGGECTERHGCCSTAESCKRGRCQGYCSYTKFGKKNLCYSLHRIGTFGCCVGYECKDVQTAQGGGVLGTCEVIKGCNRTKEECVTGKCCDRNDECKSDGKKKVCTKTYGTEEDSSYNWSIDQFFKK